jgi:tetratricopeptide (TPR) repeat protein
MLSLGAVLRATGVLRGGVVLVGLVLASRLALAAPDPEIARAKALFQRAEVHFSVGEFVRALELYKEAYKRKPLPGFLFNIGQCHRNLGQCDRAVFFYKQYLLRAGDPPNKEEVARLIEICERAPRLPASVPATLPRSRPAVPTSTPESRVVRPPLPPPPPAPIRRGLRPGWFWSGVALSAALLGTGVATGVLALQKSAEYKEPDTPIARREELRDAGQALSTTASVTVAAGAATAVGTIVLFILTDFRRAEERPGSPAATIGFGPIPGGGAALLGGTF